MRNKYLLPIIMVSLLVSLLLAWQVWAGSPDSLGAPNATSSYTLQDLYNRLTTGTAGAQSVFTEPTTAPGTGTMHTLNEIMAAAPALDNTHGATSTQVLSGQTFWGLRAGQWATQTGAMPNNGAVTFVPTTTNVTISAGYHNGGGYVQGDSDLAAANIVSGTSIFGVAGSAVTASGNATNAQVLAGRTYSNDSGPSTGTMANNGAVTITPSTVTQTIAAGYHNGSGSVVGDADLVAGNIKQGVTVFGVNGTLASTLGVPETGQTLCYDSSGGQIACAGTGQDGEYRAGVAWPSPRFTDQGDGTVRDNLTGLVWLKNANCFGQQTWANALNAANTLGNGECGLSDGSADGDWRLPNVRELTSLTDFSQVTPALPSGHPFTTVISDRYWTSNMRSSGYGWAMDMNTGAVYLQDSLITFYVWPVRGGQ